MAILTTEPRHASASALAARPKQRSHRTTTHGQRIPFPVRRTRRGSRPHALAFRFSKRCSPPATSICPSLVAYPTNPAHDIINLFSKCHCAVRGFVRTHFLPFTRSDRESRTTLHLPNLWKTLHPLRVRNSVFAVSFLPLFLHHLTFHDLELLTYQPLPHLTGLQLMHSFWILKPS